VPNAASRRRDPSLLVIYLSRADERTCREIKDAVHSLENIQVADLMALLGRVKGVTAGRH
jgi:hypothetical protein